MKSTETSHNNLKKSILLVDDDRLILSTLASGLMSAGYHVDTAESVDDAEHWLDNNERPDMVMLDMRMPGRYGIELATKLKAMNNTPFILLTAFNEAEIIEKAKAAGAMGYLIKPIDVNQMIPTLETAISRSEELQALRMAKVHLQSALEGDRAISVAVGIMMDREHLSHDDAFEALRKHARSNHLKLTEVANSVIKASETLNILPHAATRKPH